MRSFSKSLTMSAILIASLCFALPSQAKTLHITAQIGQQTRVYGHIRLAKNCTPGVIPDMTIITPPQLGKLSTALETVTLTAPDFGTCGPGTAGPGKVVYYTAQKSGHDSFHYRMSSPGLPTTDWLVTVDVP